MDFKQLHHFDLNTLVAFKVLLDEQHVTRAADKLALTQSAVSRILAKLRQAFNDPLLVKTGKQLSLTPKALRLYQPVTQVLEQVSNILQPEQFDPASGQGSIRIATNDYGSHNLLPKLIPLLTQVAPHIEVNTLDWRADVLAELEQNKVDIIIAGTTSPPENVHQRVIATDRFQGLVRKGHPNEQQLTLSQYLALKHVMISPTGSGSSEVDDILKKLGHERQVALRMPHFFAALEIIAKTDFMILLPSHFIRRYVDLTKFSVVDIPFDVPEFTISMFWHARMHHEPMHTWFRNFVFEHIYLSNKKAD